MNDKLTTWLVTLICCMIIFLSGMYAVSCTSITTSEPDTEEIPIIYDTPAQG